MRIIKTKTYEEMSAIAAGIIGGQVLLKPNCVLGLATGSSPIGTYKDLVKSYEDGVLDFSEVRTVNLDEYCGLDGTNPNSYRYFMNDNLFDHVNIDKANTHVPNGTQMTLKRRLCAMRALFSLSAASICSCSASATMAYRL